MSPPTLNSGARYMLLATLYLALMNVGVKLLPGIPAHEIVFFRALVSLVVAYAMLRRQRLSVWGNNRPLLIWRGLAGTTALVCYFYSLHLMPLASAVTIQQLSPIFTILLSSVLLGEHASRKQWGAFMVAFAGVVLVKGFDPRVTIPEALLCMAAAFFAGLAYNLVRMLKDHDHPLVVVFYFPVVTVPLVGAYTLTHWVWPDPGQLALLLGVGLATTASQVYLTRAFQADRASRVSIINYLGVVLALVIGWLGFDEGVGPMALMGAGVIIGAVAWATRQGAAS